MYAVYMYKLVITVTVFSRRIVYSAVVRVDDEIVVFISALKKSYVIGISYRAGGLKFICAKDRSSLYVENVRKAVLKLAPLIAQANEQLKPAVAVVSCRRAGATATLDGLNKYMTIAQMPVVSSGYWNMVHGNTPDEVRQDLEGMQVMRTLGRNMAWLLKSIEAGRNAGLPLPEREKRIATNFIR